MSNFRVESPLDGRRMPLIVRPMQAGQSLIEFASTHREDLDRTVLEHGAVLLRGFEVGSVDDFARFGPEISSERLDYHYRSTPRTAVGGGVFTATEYPKHQSIPLHSENAYQREWPMKVVFWCRRPAEAGGETPIADLRTVSATIGSDVLEEFARRGVRYIRHFRPNVDLSWEVAFQTSDRMEVARYCREHEIEHDWLEPDLLRTVQECQGVAIHPRSGETVFFNQAHLFHPSALPPDVSRALVQHYGSRLPRNSTFADGGELGWKQLRTIRSAFKQNEIVFPWLKDDVLVLDNMQTAHGRRPFVGQREHLTLLLDPHVAVNANHPLG